ncbi:MAG: low molecular weight phosphotyrosine protein phosphatase [Cellvibrionales bacterium]|nr:low molecular weight phosphotyrosine protein phosphatase [Cellvibrionales bacterium]
MPQNQQNQQIPHRPDAPPKTAVLFVCLGNICRSPTAHGVFTQQVAAAGLSHAIRTDSAGTGDWHLGEPPDRRTQHHAQQRNIDLSALRARQVRPADFREFDYILAMDRQNLRDLQAMRPPTYAGTLALFLDYLNPENAGKKPKHQREVPDPYYGGADGFEQVLDLVEQAARNLLREIAAQLR